MSIIRIENTRICNPSKIRYFIDYLRDKQQYMNQDYSNEPYMIKTHGLISDANDTNALTNELLLQHFVFYGGGKDLKKARHLFIDFNCPELSPRGAANIAWEINTFWIQHNVSFIQGVHLYKGGHSNNYNTEPIYSPHVHILLSTRIMTGPMKGHYLSIDRNMLCQYKIYANRVLAYYHMEEINIERITGEPYEIPEGYDVPCSCMPIGVQLPFYIHPSHL